MEDLGITVAISADDADFDKKVSAVNKEITALKNSANRLKKELKLDPSNLETMRKRADELKKALEKAKVVYKAWNDMRDKQLIDGASVEELKKTEEQINKAHQRVLSLQIAWQKATDEIEKSTNKLKKFADTMEKVSDVSGKVANAFAPLSKLSQNFLKEATQGAIDFESAFADVQKTVKSTGSELMDTIMFDDLEDSAKQMSTYLPVTAKELAKLMGLAGQMNVPVQQLAEFTELMVKFGDSTNITAEEAVTDIAQIYNVIGKGGDFSDLNNLLSAIVELGNNSATTEKDITTMFKNISAGASSVKMTEAQMVALSATLSSLGLDKGGASAISKIMREIDMAVTQGGKDLTEWANIVGESGTAFKEAWSRDSAQVLLDIVTSMSKMTDEGISMNKILSDLDIKELRQVDTLSRLVKAHDEYAKNIGLANKAYEDGTALNTEAEKRYKTLASQMQILKNNFQLFAITLGETLMPYMQQLIDGLMQLAEWLNKLDPQTKNIIITITALLAVITPLFSGISKIAGGLSAIATFIDFVKTKLAPLVTLLTNFISGPLANLIILASNHPIMTAITALIAVGVILYNHCESFKEIIDNIMKGTKELWEEFKKTQWIESLGNHMGLLGQAIGVVIEMFTALIQLIVTATSKVLEFVGSFGGIGEMMWSAGNWLGGLFHSGGFGALASGGFASAGITLNASFNVQSNNITRRDVQTWSEWLADDINEALGRRI